eukprot:PhM_4_TR11692/c1_g2_i1/m.23702
MSRQRGVDVVQAYAAKRQAQLEHAAQLRQERKNQQLQQQQPQQQYEPPIRQPTPQYEDLEGYDMRTSNDNNNNNNTYIHQMPPASHQPSSRGSAVSPTIVNVSEESFMRAVREGVVSMDQARQLWFMLSGRQPITMSTPMSVHNPYVQQQPPMRQARAESPPPPPPQAIPGESPGRNVYSMTPEMSSESQYVRQDPVRPSAKRSSKPEWNFNTDPVDGFDEPPPPATRKEPSLSLLKQRQTERRQSRPDWNFDVDPVLGKQEEVDDVPVASVRKPVPKPVGKQNPSKPASRQQKSQPRPITPQQQQQQQQEVQYDSDSATVP